MSSSSATFKPLRSSSPETVIRFTTAELDAHPPLDEVDCAILFGDCDWPGYESRLLIPEEVLPLAAPELAGRLIAAELLGRRLEGSRAKSDQIETLVSI